MTRRPTLTALCLTTSCFFAVGCSGEPEGANVDPDVRKAVETFCDALTRPTLDKAGKPNVETAYEQLHPDAKKQQTLKQFNRYWMDWVTSRGPGWILTAEISGVETMADSVLVVVSITLGDQLNPQWVQGLPLRLTLRKEGTRWVVYSIEG